MQLNETNRTFDFEMMQDNFDMLDNQALLDCSQARALLKPVRQNSRYILDSDLPKVHN